MGRLNMSGYKGVSWCKTYNKWYVKIYIDGVQVYIGRYLIKEEAALAYDEAMVEYGFEAVNFK